MATQRQIAANRANASRSTGPRTAQGKARSSLNAFRHGLTGQVVVLTEQDLAAWHSHCQAFAAQYQPDGPVEQQLVQQLADYQWRLSAAAACQMNLFALGGHRKGRKFNTGNHQVDTALAHAETLDEKIQCLATLTLYEQRLHRSYDKVLSRLTTLQSARRCREHAEELRRQRDLKPEENDRDPKDRMPPDSSGPAIDPNPEIGFVSSNVAHASACSGRLQPAVVKTTATVSSSATPPTSTTLQHETEQPKPTTTCGRNSRRSPGRPSRIENENLPQPRAHAVHGGIHPSLRTVARVG